MWTFCKLSPETFIYFGFAPFFNLLAHLWWFLLLHTPFLPLKHVLCGFHQHKNKPLEFLRNLLLLLFDTFYNNEFKFSNKILLLYRIKMCYDLFPT